jgi:hypothetical protein
MSSILCSLRLFSIISLESGCSLHSVFLAFSDTTPVGQRALTLVIVEVDLGFFAPEEWEAAAASGRSWEFQLPRGVYIQITLEWLYYIAFTFPSFPKDKVWSCCPKDWKPFGSYCYFTSTDLVASWNESKENCFHMGAHLVVIHSQEEQVHPGREQSLGPTCCLPVSTKREFCWCGCWCFPVDRQEWLP